MDNETTTADLDQVYTIPVESFKGFTKKISALVARAEKLSGSTDIVMEVLPDLVNKTYYNDKDKKSYVVPCRQVRVSGSAPKVTAEWKLLGVVDRATLDGEVLFKMVPGQARSQHALEVGESGVCEHCGLRRNRKATFILLNVENGEEKLVGRQCIRDFLGHVTPAMVALMASLMDSLFNTEVPSPRFSAEREGFEITWFLAHVIYDISVRGFYDKVRTVSIASDVMTFAADGKLPFSADLAAEIKERARITEDTNPELWTKANAVVEWATTQVDASGSTYWENVNKVLKNGIMPLSTERLIASIVVSYDRAMGNIKEREVLKASEHVGKVGDKVNVDLTLIRVHNFERQVTNWHTSPLSICTFRDNDGNCIVWKASKFIDGAEMTDKVFKVRGTIKAHDEYKGTKQTLLTRCTMEPLA